MSEELAGSYERVVVAVRAFNKGLEENPALRRKLPYFRAWYYVPELEMVGPSKFIGYEGMTAAEYLEKHSKVLDGRDTEPHLSEWFDELDPDDEETRAEAEYVKRLVMDLLGRYGKSLNKKARFAAPEGWTLPGGMVVSREPDAVQRQRDVEGGGSMVQVFWRAFLTLYPDDQEALARRISAYMGDKQ